MIIPLKTKEKEEQSLFLKIEKAEPL